MFVIGTSRATFAVSLGATIVAASLRPAAPYATLSDLARHRASIARVKVYSIAADISTMVAVTPAALENFHGVHVRTHTSRRSIDALIDAFELANPATDRDPFDARFGIVFEDRSGLRRFAAYTNAGASQGMLGHRSVAFDDAAPLARALRSASM